MDHRVRSAQACSMPMGICAISAPTFRMWRDRHWGATRSTGFARSIRGSCPSFEAILVSVRALAAVGKIIGVGLNYRDHAAESGMPIPTEPPLFMKATSAIIGPNDDVEIPRGSEKTDWEVELGIVIGEPCKYVYGARGDRPRCWLLHRERYLRTRLAARAGRAVGQGQGVRHVRTDRSLARHRR